MSPECLLGNVSAKSDMHAPHGLMRWHNLAAEILKQHIEVANPSPAEMEHGMRHVRDVRKFLAIPSIWEYGRCRDASGLKSSSPQYMCSVMQCTGCLDPVAQAGSEVGASPTRPQHAISCSARRQVHLPPYRKVGTIFAGTFKTVWFNLIEMHENVYLPSYT